MFHPFSSSASHQLDYEIYNNLINLLTSQKVSNLTCLDHHVSLTLDQPIKLLNYGFLDKELEIESHSKIDLAYMINKLLTERSELIILLEKTNKERKVSSFVFFFLQNLKKLREDNINLLRQIFFRTEPSFQENFQKFFNRAFLMNYEFMQAFLERERKVHSQLLRSLSNKDEEIHNMGVQLHKLEKVLFFFVGLHNNFNFNRNFSKQRKTSKNIS